MAKRYLHPRLIVPLVVLSTLCVCHGFNFQPTFLDPVYDTHGNEISRDRVLEIMDMKSTLLGHGIGFNKYTFGTTIRPHVHPFLRRSYRRIPYSPHAYQTRIPPTRRHHKRQADVSADEITEDVLEHLSQVPYILGDHDASFSDFPSNFPSGAQAPSGMNKKSCGRPQVIECNPHSRYRTIDGLCNNLAKPKWGAVMQPLRRLHNYNFYYDGFDVPRLTSTVNNDRLLPSARFVSRNVHQPDMPGQENPVLTSLIQTWGQFTDHDITGTPAHKDSNGEDLKCCRNIILTGARPLHPDVFKGGPCDPIYIPPNDRFFNYACMNFARSQPTHRKKDCDPYAPKEVRQQMNMLTSYMDASQVYGSSLKDNDALRLYRYGMLRVTPLDLLPEDMNITCVKDTPGDYCFRAGDMRVNEHAALSTLHTVFQRLHNQMAIALTRLNPKWDDETIFQEVRKIIGAVMQFVQYHEWLPIILGPDTMSKYGLNVQGLRDHPSSHSNYWYYDENADATVINSFATAAFRFGHTLIPGTFTVGHEKIDLHFTFNRPHLLLRDDGRSVGKYCSGLMHDSLRTYDRFITTELTDRLFEDKNNISMDLASLNIQRARDHGLPPYNDFREICGLPRIRSFDEWYQEEPDKVEAFKRVYDHVDDIDLFSGGISESSLPGAIVGPTFACIIGRQFRNLKYGDRFWFESEDNSVAFTPEQIREIRSFSLSRVICTMAPLRDTLVNPFYKDGSYLPEPVVLTNGEVVSRNRYVPCNLLKTIDMRAWYDPNARYSNA